MAEGIVHEPLTPFALMEYYEHTAYRAGLNLWVRYVNEVLRAHVIELAKTGETPIYDTSGDARQVAEWRCMADEVADLFRKAGWTVERVDPPRGIAIEPKDYNYPHLRFRLPGKIIGEGGLANG